MVVIFHMYIIVHEYFGLPKKPKKRVKMGFKNQQNIFLPNYFLHIWPSSIIKNFEPNFFIKITKWFNN
jgi:hypothetical protein